MSREMLRCTVLAASRTFRGSTFSRGQSVTVAIGSPEAAELRADKAWHCVSVNGYEAPGGVPATGAAQENAAERAVQALQGRLEEFQGTILAGLEAPALAMYHDAVGAKAGELLGIVAPRALGYVPPKPVLSALERIQDFRAWLDSLNGSERDAAVSVLAVVLPLDIRVALAPPIPKADPTPAPDLDVKPGRPQKAEKKDVASTPPAKLDAASSLRNELRAAVPPHASTVPPILADTAASSSPRVEAPALPPPTGDVEGFSPSDLEDEPRVSNEPPKAPPVATPATTEVGQDTKVSELSPRQAIEAAISNPSVSLFNLRGFARQANLTLPEGAQSMNRNQLVAAIKALLAEA